MLIKAKVLGIGEVLDAPELLDAREEVPDKPIEVLDEAREEVLDKARKEVMDKAREWVLDKGTEEVAGGAGLHHGGGGRGADSSFPWLQRKIIYTKDSWILLSSFILCFFVVLCNGNSI